MSLLDRVYSLLQRDEDRPASDFPTKELVDELGYHTEARKAIAHREEELKQELKSRGLGHFAGQVFEANVTEGHRETLDKDAIRRKMGSAWLQHYSQITDFAQVSVRRLPSR